MTVQTSPAFENAIRNPDNPAHLMVIKPVQQRVRIYAGDALLADTAHALRVREIGQSIYDPVVYVPASDLTASLEPVEKSTFCPIKGTAAYVALCGEEIGWIYKAPIEPAQQLAAHYAFWPSRTRLVVGD